MNMKTNYLVSSIHLLTGELLTCHLSWPDYNRIGHFKAQGFLNLADRNVRCVDGRLRPFITAADIRGIALMNPHIEEDLEKMAMRVEALVSGVLVNEAMVEEAKVSFKRKAYKQRIREQKVEVIRPVPVTITEVVPEPLPAVIAVTASDFAAFREALLAQLINFERLIGDGPAPAAA